MGVFTFEDEEVSTVAPAKLYKALAKDSDTIIPKVVEAIQSIEIVEGNGGPGTIKKLTVVEGGKSIYVLHKVEAIDEANLGYNYSLVGGTGLEDILEKVSFETKVLPGPNGGSVGKLVVKYHTKGDAVLSEEVREGTKAKGTALFKAVEGYVLANPDY
ncbi:class 10 plant pathogenesis-related protein 2F-like [Gastrolobium bilobum]|uniref:class 10 plant pathogenesis-related protein 2F-like n=1 Tax=Gastrolobium bilobum TaxID=150636 RepID=UPI002AB1953F|nr:class 10 plant pathogenesis-related protein 2F-like [Gastrolobium bilobum]